MKRLLHVGVVMAALSVTLGIPAVAFGVPGLLFGANAPDAVSRASTELPEQPSGNFVILLNTDKHPGTAADWETFFSGRETDVIMDDVACMAADGDVTGIQLAERFRSRLAENQMTLRQVNGTLLASRADAGVFDVVIVSEEMADMLALKTAYDRTGTAVVTVRGGPT